MTDLKETLSANLTALRKEAGWTQAELAARINYSDKAVSKWERAEGMPDLTVMVQLSELFGVSLDFLVGREGTAKPKVPASARQRKNRGIITALSVSLVWLIATMIFVIFGICSSTIGLYWLCFVYAVPLTFIVLLVFNCVWGRLRRNYFLISCLVWTVLFCTYLTLLVCGYTSYIWLIFILGIPSQGIILLWSGLNKQEKIDC